MRFISAPSLVLLLAAGFTLPAFGEQLQMPAQGNSGSSSSQVSEMPVKGMSKMQVEQHFGKPQQVLAPVGDPPISRWVYDGYTVYFEYSHVIHSVPHR